MERGRAPRRWGSGPARAAAAAVLVLAMAAPTLAAVEPGLYFDSAKASPGQRVLLFSAADYVVCWGPGSEEQTLRDRAVYLAPSSAEVSTAMDPDLERVGGTWSEREGALFFSFRVPSLAAGRYLGYVACDSGILEVSARPLRIVAVPSTDAVPALADSGTSAPWPILAVAALVACLAGAARFGREPRRR